jgi:hypothetical protein
LGKQKRKDDRERASKFMESKTISPMTFNTIDQGAEEKADPGTHLGGGGA